MTDKPHSAIFQSYQGSHLCYLNQVEYLEKTTDMWPFTDKPYRIILYRFHLDWNGILLLFPSLIQLPVTFWLICG